MECLSLLWRVGLCQCFKRRTEQSDEWLKRLTWARTHSAWRCEALCVLRIMWYRRLKEAGDNSCTSALPIKYSANTICFTTNFNCMTHNESLKSHASLLCLWTLQYIRDANRVLAVVFLKAQCYCLYAIPQTQTFTADSHHCLLFLHYVHSCNVNSPQAEAELLFS